MIECPKLLCSPKLRVRFIGDVVEIIRPYRHTQVFVYESILSLHLRCPYLRIRCWPSDHLEPIGFWSVSSCSHKKKPGRRPGQVQREPWGENFAEAIRFARLEGSACVILARNAPRRSCGAPQQPISRARSLAKPPLVLPCFIGTSSNWHSRFRRFACRTSLENLTSSNGHSRFRRFAVPNLAGESTFGSPLVTAAPGRRDRAGLGWPPGAPH